MTDTKHHQILDHIKELSHIAFFGADFAHYMHNFKLEKVDEPRESQLKYTGDYTLFFNELRLGGIFDTKGLDKFPLIVKQLVPMIDQQVAGLPELKDASVLPTSEVIKTNLAWQAHDIIAELNTDPRYMAYIERHSVQTTPEGPLYPSLLLQLKADVLQVPQKAGQLSDVVKYVVIYYIRTVMIMALNYKDACDLTNKEVTVIRDTIQELLARKQND